MSLKMCKLPVTAFGPLGAQTEPRPRCLQQPNAFGDSTQISLEKSGKLGASASCENPHSKLNGNCKPQEPAHSTPWQISKFDGPRKPQHIHPQPWTNSASPGKRESPEGLNPFHRVWLTDGDRKGGRPRWNRQRKREYFAKKDTALFEQIPAMEKFNRSGAHYVTWSHLLDGGTAAGGHEQKLDYSYAGWSRGPTSPSRPSEHFYLGKYENVKHVQRICKTGAQDATGRMDELQKDTDRKMFDNRLKDDMIRANDAETRWAASGSYDCFRPTATASAPQLGADWCNR
eukprot:TRINITY_DN90643_c0_g1_i1.p1 TRINITY_DN90643_c0_g1~~TRINITY_DN90643_c0_g1_i1.p1  ORF type:complete len:287 (-),score=31.42 TRINITY_DN90643_c0_g1_i1:149-1009(-)